MKLLNPIYLRAVLTLACIALSGCASSSLPEAYTGPTATIRDSITPLSKIRANAFWVDKVDGRTIETSPNATRKKNYGQGASMEPEVIERKVPAQKMILHINASVIFGADFFALTNKSYRVSGDIELEAKPDKIYIVKGVISREKSAVWIEDADSGELVTTKVEKSFK